jgi:hypothetical protein
MTYNRYWLNLTLIAMLGATGALFACTSSSNNNPTPSDDGGAKKGTGGTKATKDAGTAGKSGTGGSKSSTGGAGGSTDEDAGGGTGGTGGSGSTGCAKDSSKGCYTCDGPTSDDEFLNHCTAATCTAYDNSKLTKLGANGKLPDLP